MILPPSASHLGGEKASRTIMIQHMFMIMSYQYGYDYSALHFTVTTTQSIQQCRQIDEYDDTRAINICI
jgi:hypothetical protein